eukprot:m.164411 g.164411  ORF g.164411 m.164411 type:complete len:421 (+) comp16408_c0_seq2:56-1318(+)
MIKAPGYRWGESDTLVCLSFDVDKAVTITDVNVEIEETNIRCWVEGEEPIVCGLLHQHVLPGKSGWRLDKEGPLPIVHVWLFKRVPISWSYPIKGDISAEYPCDAQSHVFLARFFEAENDPSYLHHWQKAAECGHPDALVALAHLYLVGPNSGLNIKQDLNTCKKLLESATEQHHPEAMLMLGQLYQEGAFGNPNNQEALDWYRRSLQPEVLEMYMRHTNSQEVPLYANVAHYNSATILLQGDATPESIEAGLACLQVAADHGYARAVLKMGVMLFKGDIVQQDIGKGCEYVLSAVQLDPTLNIPHDILQVVQAYANAKGPFKLSSQQHKASNRGTPSPLHSLDTDRHHKHSEGAQSPTSSGTPTTESPAPFQPPSKHSSSSPNPTSSNSEDMWSSSAFLSIGFAAAVVATFLALHLRQG